MTANEVRSVAITEVLNRTGVETAEIRPLSEIWATDVFNLDTMEEALSKNAFKAVKKTVQTGEPLDPATADIVAWVESGGPGITEPPGILDLYAFRPSRRVQAELHDE